MGPDNYFEVQVDGEAKVFGSLLDKFEPPITPSRYIDDPTDKKPANWVEEQYIDDPDAKKPDDWDDEEDGEWQPMLIDNPACKAAGCGRWEHPMIENPKFVGKWEPPTIDNPNYKGEWSPQKMENPNYFFDEHPALFPSIDAVGFDLWTMQGGILFDNMIVSLGNVSLAKEFTDQTWA